MSNHWHPKSGTRRKGIHPILLDGGGRFDREHAARCIQARRQIEDRMPYVPPAVEKIVDYSAAAVFDHPWPFVVLLGFIVGTVTFLGYMAF